MEPNKNQLRKARRVALDACRSPISPMQLNQVLERAEIPEKTAKYAIAAELGKGLRLAPGFDLQTVGARRRREV